MSIDTEVVLIVFSMMVTSCDASYAGKDSWKQRNEALGTILEKVSASIKFGITASPACKDLLVALVRRFADTNQNLRPVAVNAIAAVAKGVGKDIEKVRNCCWRWGGVSAQL